MWCSIRQVKNIREKVSKGQESAFILNSRERDYV